MSIANAAQALATEQEYVRPELEYLCLSASVFWKRVQKNTSVKPVSDRPTRVPTVPSGGGKPRVANLNGGDLGIGSGPTTVPGQLTTTAFSHAFSYTAQAEYATDSDEKAIENFATWTRAFAPKQFANFLDIQAQGNGSGQIDTILSTVLSGGLVVGLVVTNANFFLDDQDLDIWTAVGGTFITTVTCQSSDILGNTLWLQTPAPATVVAGQGIFVNGSPAQANSGLMGIRAYQVATNTSNWMGVQRSAWPGKYNTPFVPVNGALTPQSVRALQSLVELSKGEDAEDDMVAHCNVDARDAWEQNALLVQHIDMAQLKGDTSVDMLKRNAPNQIGGREMVVNPRALPGYIDFLKFKNIFAIETAPVDFYSVAGQTLFPLYGASGGIMTAMVFYMIYEGQLGFVQTRENAFMSGITIPKYLLGH